MLVWHAMEYHVVQSTQSASGVLHLMPLGTAALRGKERRSAGRGEAQLELPLGCMGGSKIWEWCDVGRVRHGTVAKQT